MSKLKQPEPEVVRAQSDDFIEPEQSFQELLSASAVVEESVDEPVVKVKTPVITSPAKEPRSPVNSPDSFTSSNSSNSFGFRANLLKHGLTALEKIGKTTADVVVSTRNKMTEATAPEFVEALPPRPFNPITPDYHDAKSTFLETFQLYGGLLRITVIQTIHCSCLICVGPTNAGGKVLHYHEASKSQDGKTTTAAHQL